jgi:signal transduction histidine kinase/CheY-like chemotaxis protein
MVSETGAQQDRTATAVKAQRIRVLFQQSPWTLGINPLNAAIVGTVMWSPARAAMIVTWVAAMAAVSLARLSLRRRYLARGAPPDAAWGRRYALLAGAAGVLWGAGSLLLYTPHEHAAELILIFVIGGMTAGAAGTMSYHLPAFRAYAAPTLLPLAVRMMLVGDRLHLAMGLLGLVFSAALAIVALNSNRAITAAFRLRFENDTLLASLSRAQASLEEVNRTLERRVEERSVALQRQTEALQEARRMESLGLLAGGVAHDFNNLLTVILGNAALLQESPEIARADDGPLAEIRGASERAAALVSQLLALGRRQARQARVLDLNHVVSAAHKLLARLIGEHIQLRVSQRGEPLPVDADPAQLEQVIVNLATNARDAMAAGGKLSIETDVVDVAASDEDGIPPGTYVTLSVIDTGVGMDAETRRRVFEPFFTTKGLGHGTGLGLATVNGIVEQSRGRVVVTSEPGKGSCFRVFLPRARRSIASESPPAPVAQRRWTGTALLVEDEPAVRDVVSRTLLGAGLTILEAEDGEQALERARAHGGPIALLVTDVVMARLGGPELARRLADERPELRVLFISGYNPGAEVPSTAEERVDFLQKPFTASALLERVARLLADDREPTGPGPRQPSWRRGAAAS